VPPGSRKRARRAVALAERKSVRKSPPFLASQGFACYPLLMKYLTIFGILIITTALEACGDAVIRMGLQSHAAWPARIGLFAAGTVLLLGYGTTLNLAPQEFGKLIGAYVATFFVMAQIINLIVFRTPPSLPILVGGAFILAGGAIITFWQPVHD